MKYRVEATSKNPSEDHPDNKTEVYITENKMTAALFAGEGHRKGLQVKVFNHDTGELLFEEQ